MGNKGYKDMRKCKNCSQPLSFFGFIVALLRLGIRIDYENLKCSKCDMRFVSDKASAFAMIAMGIFAGLTAIFVERLSGAILGKSSSTMDITIGLSLVVFFMLITQYVVYYYSTRPNN